ncbi:hypothetical protein QAD02_022636 [Eretmocerus hayati]|uniref:Uncharacterized protein n=1 Tax=Eretmocerus hayati TaxID=131215 RepID=A0ACC2PTT5_9HYME|nr:hypothetical protein QAD02_022636 [Eretmocerus hayati]
MVTECKVIKSVSMCLTRALDVTKKTQVSPIRAHLCLKCGKTYVHDFTLRRHMKYECGQPARFCCDYCPHRSKYKANVQQHILQLHKELTPLVDPLQIDDQIFSLEEPTIIDLEDESNELPNLDVSTANSVVLLPRANIVISDVAVSAIRKYRPYVCLKCNKAYKTSGHLTQHTKYDCGFARKFKCGWCSHQSKRKADLRRHIMGKHRNKDFKCVVLQ